MSMRLKKLLALSLSISLAATGIITDVGENSIFVAAASKTTEVKGIVTEASFKDGTGKVKVNGEYYSIAYITSIRDTGSGSSGDTTTDSTTGSTTTKTKA